MLVFFFTAGIYLLGRRENDSPNPATNSDRNNRGNTANIVVGFNWRSIQFPVQLCCIYFVAAVPTATAFLAAFFSLRLAFCCCFFNRIRSILSTGFLFVVAALTGAGLLPAVLALADAVSVTVVDDGLGSFSSELAML